MLLLSAADDYYDEHHHTAAAGAEMIWFTSDMHYGHQGVIDYCKRPWQWESQMNEALIDNYNKCVGVADTCYILGDVSFMRKSETEAILRRLNGHKYLVRGNHDRDRSNNFFIKRCGFKDVYSITHTVNIGLTPALLCHYPYREHNVDGRYVDVCPMNEGKWLLHGHVHHHWRTKKRMINVGVDVWDYKPVSEEEIWGIMNDEQ